MDGESSKYSKAGSSSPLEQRQTYLPRPVKGDSKARAHWAAIHPTNIPIPMPREVEEKEVSPPEHHNYKLPEEHVSDWIRSQRRRKPSERSTPSQPEPTIQTSPSGPIPRRLPSPDQLHALKNRKDTQEILSLGFLTPLERDILHSLRRAKRSSYFRPLLDPQNELLLVAQQDVAILQGIQKICQGLAEKDKHQLVGDLHQFLEKKHMYVLKLLLFREGLSITERTEGSGVESPRFVEEKPVVAARRDIDRPSTTMFFGFVKNLNAETRGTTMMQSPGMSDQRSVDQVMASGAETAVESDKEQKPLSRFWRNVFRTKASSTSEDKTPASSDQPSADGSNVRSAASQPPPVSPHSGNSYQVTPWEYQQPSPSYQRSTSYRSDHSSQKSSTLKTPALSDLRSTPLINYFPEHMRGLRGGGGGRSTNGSHNPKTSPERKGCCIPLLRCKRRKKPQQQQPIIPITTPPVEHSGYIGEPTDIPTENTYSPPFNIEDHRSRIFHASTATLHTTPISLPSLFTNHISHVSASSSTPGSFQTAYSEPHLRIRRGSSHLHLRGGGRKEEEEEDEEDELGPPRKSKKKKRNNSILKSLFSRDSNSSSIKTFKSISSSPPFPTKFKPLTTTTPNPVTLLPTAHNPSLSSFPPSSSSAFYQSKKTYPKPTNTDPWEITPWEVQISPSESSERWNGGLGRLDGSFVVAGGGGDDDEDVRAEKEKKDEEEDEEGENYRPPLRGGGGGGRSGGGGISGRSGSFSRKKVTDDESRVPQGWFWLAGGRGRAPTRVQWRDWRDGRSSKKERGRMEEGKGSVGGEGVVGAKSRASKEEEEQGGEEGGDEVVEGSRGVGEGVGTVSREV